MKRDLELIRKLVLAVEDNPTGFVKDDIVIDGFSKEQVGYHAYLVVDSGLGKGLDVTTMSDTSPQWHILHLTSAGHDFAAATRAEPTWKKATDLLKDKAGGVTLDVLKQVLTSIAKNALGI